jgi:hypothetical protein
MQPLGRFGAGSGVAELGAESNFHLAFGELALARPG